MVRVNIPSAATLDAVAPVKPAVSPFPSKDGSTTRHAMLELAIGGMAALVFGAGHSAHAQSDCASNPNALIIYHAGSLSAAFTAVEKLFTQQTGACITDVAAGSLDAARRVSVGQEPADIAAAADYLDVSLLLQPAGLANYTIAFAEGGMVLAYTTNSRNADGIAGADAPFNPPGSVPKAAADWYRQLAQPGVLIGGSHPFLDPSGYRADMIFQLAALHYSMPALYNTLLGHYTITRPGDALGLSYDYQFIYEHSALAAYQANPSAYRYVKLPPAVSLARTRQDMRYGQASIVVPGLGLPDTAPKIAIPATRVVWGLTILRAAPNHSNAVQFLQLLFSPQGVALQSATGPTPISPPAVSAADYDQIPAELQPLVSRQ